MTKTRKMWVAFVGVMLTVFALLIAACAVFDFLKLPDFALIFDFDLSILSFLSFLGEYLLVAVFSLAALLLLICAIVCFSPFKGKNAKYTVAIIFGVLIQVAVAVWMILSVVDSYSNTVLIYVVVMAFPFLTLLFAIFASFSSGDQQEQADVASIKVEHHEEEAKKAEVPHKAQVSVAEKPLEHKAFQTPEEIQPIQPQIYAGSQAPVSEQAPERKKVETAEERKFNPYYGTHGSERVADVVARVYGNQSDVVDETKRKKLEKINQMFELGVINRFEYQQLTIRILNDK